MRYSTLSFSSMLRAMILVMAVTFGSIGVSAKDFVVVIDAGHGGKDPGALGSITNEKSINLAVARQLEKEISSRYKDVNVVMTRSTDIFVTIKGRMDKAKAVNADLFISLHCNSAALSNPRRSSLSGTSVYVLGNNNVNDNIDLAMRENSAILMEDNYKSTYQGFDNSPEYYIFTEINQSKMMGKSNSVANEIQRQLVSHAKLADKHVNETSRLWLLLHSTMPAILIEMDYICNPERERFLNSASGQNKIASAICNGIENYRKTLGHKPKINKSAKTPDESEPDLQTTSPEQNDNTPENSDRSDKKSKAKPNDKKKTATGQTLYHIQFLVSPSRLADNSPKLKGLSPVHFYIDNGSYKYYYGEYPSMNAATADLPKIRKLFNDAFVIKTIDGKRTK